MLVHTSRSVSRRRVRAAALLASLTAGALMAGSTADVATAGPGDRSDRGRAHGVPAAKVPAATGTFFGSGTGAIPDGMAQGADCDSDVVPGVRDVTFQVTGVSGPISDVSVSATLRHTYVGDLTATLIAPGGASVTLFDRPHAPAPSICGDDSDLAGVYVFNDQAAASPGAQLAARGNTEALPPGPYRATSYGSTAPVSLTAPFTGVSAPNGTWTLRLMDSGSGTDAGRIDITSLTLTWQDLDPCRAATESAAKAAKKLKKAQKALRAAHDHLDQVKAAHASAAVVSAAATKVRNAAHAKKRAHKKLKKARAAQAGVCP